MEWKKGRGKLGLFDPLMGVWQAQADSEIGPVTCRREFTKVLSGQYVRLQASWQLSNGSYDELALIGVNAEKEICFWSFTSDGKQSQGKLADVSDLHPEALGFEESMKELRRGLSEPYYEKLIEQAILDLQGRKHALEAQLSGTLPVADIARLGVELQQVDETLAAQEEQWLAVSEQIEAAAQ